MKNFNMERLGQKGDSIHTQREREREACLCSVGKIHIYSSSAVFLPTLPTPHSAIINSPARVLGARTLLLFVQPVMGMYLCIPAQETIFSFGIKESTAFPLPATPFPPPLTQSLYPKCYNIHWFTKMNENSSYSSSLVGFYIQDPIKKKRVK